MAKDVLNQRVNKKNHLRNKFPIQIQLCEGLDFEVEYLTEP